MVPTLQIPANTLTLNGFINAYSKDAQRDIQYEDAIYILCRPKNIDKFREFLNSEYNRTNKILDDYDYVDGYVVIVYALDPDFKNDFELIRQSKYSQTSKEFQELFPKKLSIMQPNGVTTQEFTLQYRIFNKSKDLVKHWEKELGVVFSKDQETWHRFHYDRETLNIDKLKEHVQ